MRRYTTASACLLAALAACPTARAEDAVEPLYRFVHGPVWEAFDGAQVVAAERVDLPPETVLKRPARARLPMFDGAALEATMTGFHRRGVDDATWVGRVDGEPFGRVVLTTRGGVTVGAVVGLDRTYLIEPLPGGGAVLKEVDPDAYPECGGPLVTVDTPISTRDGDTAGDTGDRIDVMILYTPQARDAAGGVPGIEATAQAAVDIANVAFADSGVTPRFHLVHTGLATRSDSGDMGADLTWLASDGSVAALRNTHGADLVSLLVNSGAYCGIGYVMRTVSPSFESAAFQVTARTCAVGNLSWAHEHGHNMGMEHDPANGASPSAASYPYSFGHFVDGSYRTVMSYSNQCGSGCTRVAHFSNPSVTHNGVPTGIANQRDNHRTANNVASTVANFRQQVVTCSPATLTLQNQTVNSTQVFPACEITAGPSFVVGSVGDVTFDAGTRVILRNGFRVMPGGRFTAQLQ